MYFCKLTLSRYYRAGTMLTSHMLVYCLSVSAIRPLPRENELQRLDALCETVGMCSQAVLYKAFPSECLAVFDYGVVVKDDKEPYM
jgi:hypothetical protein